MSMHLTGVYLLGMKLMGVHLMGVHLTVASEIGFRPNTLLKSRPRFLTLNSLTELSQAHTGV